MLEFRKNRTLRKVIRKIILILEKKILFFENIVIIIKTNYALVILVSINRILADLLVSI